MVEWMKVYVYIVMVLLLITKLFDVLSTINRIQHPSIETNPIAQKLMIRFGIGKTAWGVFGFVTVIILIAGGIALDSHQYIKILFIIFGLFLSIVQFAVAHNNWTRRTNFITKLILRYHSRIQKLLKRRI